MIKRRSEQDVIQDADSLIRELKVVVGRQTVPTRKEFQGYLADAVSVYHSLLLFPEQSIRSEFYFRIIADLLTVYEVNFSQDEFALQHQSFKTPKASAKKKAG